MKEIRIAVSASAVVIGFLLCQWLSGPIGAAPQATHKENVPPASAPQGQDPGAASYAKHCAVCHGKDREGNLPAFPPLMGISHRMSENQIADMIHHGKGAMPGFPDLQGGDLTALLRYLTTAPPSQASGNAPEGGGGSDVAEAGRALFHQNCAFCHGRDAMGGETGPDLTQSKLVTSDTTGEKIAAVIREGRPDNKMPGFNFSANEMGSLIAFIHAREAAAKAHPGGRRGVAVEDLQTGNAQAGKQYFEGAGGCTKCHSASGDLAGIARRYQGLQLEEHMLYPREAKSKLTVTLPSDEKVSGTLAYRDEFTIALHDANGIYRSWPTSAVKFTVDSPADAHVELLPKYSDDDIHNLMAYLQTLK